MEGTPEQQLKDEYERKLAELKEKRTESGEVDGEAAPVPVEHQAASETAQDVIRTEMPEFVPSSHTPGHHSDTLAPDAQEKIQAWVSATFTKDRAAGIKMAKDSGDIALIDAFHGALTGALYEKLIESGKLEQVN